ncbi:MAG TPA: ribosome biogenesis GTP-binding protein YihA/YsxC [Gemmatimonadales bacterium]|nr:ribosome biogenesis GTP-binding protein YihA/YsxC [Gemmatimonadales bacterium]
MPAPFAGYRVDFIGSFPDPLVALEPALPEVALIGRSNVGKSSLLNSLVGRPIARVSGTPGKTTLLNAFRLPTFYLVDLPGYGFARAGKIARRGYRTLVTRYLRERPTLAGVVWLLDIRHPPSADDRTIQELLVESERPVLAVLTKADKLPRGQRAERARTLARELRLPEDQIQPTSSHTGEGLTELAEAVLRLADGAGGSPR